MRCVRPGFDPCVGAIPWRRAWQPTPVFLPRESPCTEEPGGLQSVASQSRIPLECLSTAQWIITQWIKKSVIYKSIGLYYVLTSVKDSF